MSRSKPEELLAHELSCPICFQLFTDPVVLPCGHNYCRRCIEATASTAVKIDGRAPQCPECRLEFHDVDTLQRNFKLCSIIEGFKAGQTRLIPNDDRNLEVPDNEEVLCDHCIDEASPATKACLKCEVSLCSRHFQKHQEKESFRTHRVVDAQRAERATPDCATHRRPLEYFCSSDMNLLCAACFIEGRHQNHDVLSFGAAEEEMRRALESRTKVVSSRLQMTQGLLQKTVEEQGACEAIGDKLCKRAVCLMDDISALADRYKERLRELLEEERGQRRKSWHLGLGALEQQQIRLLEAQHCATEALRETDACTFIQRFVQIEQKMREAATNPLPSQLPAKAPLNTKRLQANLKTQDFRSQMSRLVDSLHILLNPLELTFNVCTCHPCLVTSADLRTVRYSGTKQPYQEHPERFTIAPQVLCSQGFSGGEHVWVVDVGASAMWSLGVCYKTIPRRGDHSRLGHNSVSWRLQWKNGKLTVCQSSCNVALGEMANQPLRIEVALDCDAGTLTFHNVVKERREHLYTFRTVFREAVYPAFSIHSTTAESWITLRSEI